MTKPHKNTPWKGWLNGTALDPVRCFIAAFIRPKPEDPIVDTAKSGEAASSDGAEPLFLPNHVIPRSAWGLPPRQPAGDDESNPEGT